MRPRGKADHDRDARRPHHPRRRDANRSGAKTTSDVRELDRLLFFLVYRPEPPSPWLALMVFLSAIGGGYGLLGVAPFLVHGRTRRRAFELLAAIVLTAILVFVVKHAVGRVRPYACLEGVHGLFFAPPRDPSFPSGHAAGSACFAAFLADRSRPVRSALLVVGAILVGLSRIVLGVHFPIDVATGATLGTAVGLMTHRYFTRLREAPLPPTSRSRGQSAEERSPRAETENDGETGT